MIESAANHHLEIWDHNFRQGNWANRRCLEMERGPSELQQLRVLVERGVTLTNYVDLKKALDSVHRATLRDLTATTDSLLTGLHSETLSVLLCVQGESLRYFQQVSGNRRERGRVESLPHRFSILV